MGYMRKFLLLLLGLSLVALPVWAANKVTVGNPPAPQSAQVAGSINPNNSIVRSFDLQNDDPIAGLAVALKFADKNDDVNITSASFEGTLLEKLQLKEAIVDNVSKTVVVYGIVLQEENIAASSKPVSIVNLTFTGKDTDKINFTPTTVGKQEGITLVTPMAKEVPFEFNGQTSPNRNAAGLPTNYEFFPNFPNPFNATTTIRYALPDNAQVRLEVFNVLGQKVKTLVDEFQTAGYKQVVWDGRNDRGDQVASGIYFYRINAGKNTQVMKMSLLK